MIHATSSPAPYLRNFSNTSPVQSLTFSFLAFPSGITRRNYFLVSRHLRQYRSAKIPPAGRDCSCIRSLFFPPFIYPSSPLTWNTGAISPKHAADRRPGAGGRAGRWTRRRPRTRSLPPLPRSHILRPRRRVASVRVRPSFFNGVCCGTRKEGERGFRRHRGRSAGRPPPSSALSPVLSPAPAPACQQQLSQYQIIASSSSSSSLDGESTPRVNAEVPSDGASE